MNDAINNGGKTSYYQFPKGIFNSFEEFRKFIPHNEKEARILELAFQMRYEYLHLTKVSCIMSYAKNEFCINYPTQEGLRTIEDVDQYCEIFNLRFNQGNILKVAWCLPTGRHKGTGKNRELNKIIYYCERELVLINSYIKSFIHPHKYLIRYRDNLDTIISLANELKSEL